MTPPPPTSAATPPPPAPAPKPAAATVSTPEPKPTALPAGARASRGEPEHFADRLEAAVTASGGGAPGCVGLDPVLERLPGAIRGSDPVEAITTFCRGVLEAVAPVVPVVKFQSACFERYGGAGVTALRNLIDEARTLGLLTILDAKRGDIGITADHYAAAVFGEPETEDGLESPGLGSSGGFAPGSADALTLSPYLGMETIAPFIRPGHGVFVLVRTSNPGGDDLQLTKLADGRTIAECIADQVAHFGAPHQGDCGLSSVGAVVGLTKAAEGEALRARMPDQVFLVPGYGAQGGSLDDVKSLLRPPGTASRGVLITASRSVIYAFPRGDADWQTRVADAAKKLQEELATMMG